MNLEPFTIVDIETDFPIIPLAIEKIYNVFGIKNFDHDPVLDARLFAALLNGSLTYYTKIKRSKFVMMVNNTFDFNPELFKGHISKY